MHYFAPKDLPPLPKNVVFVLDISASMVGAKLQQVSEWVPPAHFLLMLLTRSVISLLNDIQLMPNPTIPTYGHPEADSCNPLVDSMDLQKQKDRLEGTWQRGQCE